MGIWSGFDWRRQGWAATAVVGLVLGGAIADAGQTVLGGDAGGDADGMPAGNATTTPFDVEFRALVDEALATWHVPGVAIAVLDGDSTWTEGFGMAAFPDTPVTADTLFYTASTTKAFVATALSLMIDSHNFTELPTDGAYTGRTIKTGNTTSFDSSPLDWSTPLSAILREDFVLDNDAWATAHLTLADALTHRTGMAAHDLSLSRSRPRSRLDLDRGHGGGDAAQQPAGVREVTRSLRYLPLTSEPRTEWRYCNLMFLVLAHAIETLTGGRWLGDLLREWLWAPLGMHTTFFSLDDARAAPAPAFLAQGYYYSAAAAEHDQTASSRTSKINSACKGSTASRDCPYVAVPHMPLEEVSGAGGIISTVNDYAKWLRCWIDGPAEAAKAAKAANASGIPPRSIPACGDIPLARAGFDAIMSPKIFLDQTAAAPAPYDAPLAYASAWITSSYKGHRFWGHSGGSNAFGAEVYFFPDDRFGLVLFGNTAITSNMAELVLLWHLVDQRFGIASAERYDWSASFRRETAQRQELLATAKDRLYPDRAQPPLPPSLPFAAYTGTYYHPAYQNLTLVLAAEDEHRHSSVADNTTAAGQVVFTAERLEHTWPTLCEFVHVSGEHWMVYMDMLYERSGNFKTYARAWFQIGANGHATTLVVEFQDVADGVTEGVIPFDRI